MKIKFAAILSVDAALKAVEMNSYALRYVKDQTEAVCLKAVEHEQLCPPVRAHQGRVCFDCGKTRD